jgi:hypothetical protein
MKIFYHIALTAVLITTTAAAFEHTIEGGGRMDTVRIVLHRAAPDSAASLPHAIIYPRSVEVYSDSSCTHGLPGEVFRVEPARARVTFSPSRIILPGVDSVAVYVRYAYVPLLFRPSYSLRKMVVKSDSASVRAGRIYTEQTSAIFGDFFGPELQKSGSIVRGFTVGTNRDLTLNSGLRLQFSGKLSSDIEIVAALTDENTPIQPQGNTQTLQEFDNIFVEVKSKQYGATLGDFYFTSDKTEFGSISRKLQGAKGSAAIESGGVAADATVVGASTKGKFFTNQFAGIESVQGPYRLTGKNNEQNIIVIAGTEKVYVDGEPMTRGEANDYTIEYGSGEITFSSRRLITSASRITVDFEYSAQQYTRNFFGVSAGAEISKTASIRTSFFQEGDDPDAPIDITLTDADKELLRQSGNHPAKKSGVSFVGADSVTGIGKGQYAAVDTTIDGVSQTFYRFQPATLTALYNVGFSYVGAAAGRYIRARFGEYTFVGMHQGDYEPVIILPSPQLHQLADIAASVKPLASLELTAEVAHSVFDVNRLSTLDDNANGGNALKASIRFAPKDIRIGETSLGNIDVSFQERYIDSRFVSIDRINDIEYNRKWNIDSTTAQSVQSEETRQAAVTFDPTKTISFGGTYGTYERGSIFSSSRSSGFARVGSAAKKIADYNAELISSEDVPASSTSRWFRQKGSAEYAIGRFVPSVRFENEEKMDRIASADSLTATSLSFLEYAPKLAMSEWGGVTLSGEFDWRTENAPVNGSLVRQSSAFTQSYDAAVRSGQSFRSSATVTLRTKEYEKSFQTLNANQNSILVRSQSRYLPYAGAIDADVFYEASTERTAKLEKVFYQVQKGEGQYSWTDGNHNGVVDINDERDFTLNRYDGDYVVLTLSGNSFYPIINLKTSSRLRLTPRKFFSQLTTATERILAAFSSETYVRVEDKSTETDIKKVYFLNSSALLNPNTTLVGSQQVQQDVFVFENDPDLNFRLRYSQRKSLGQYSSGIETGYNRERSARVRFRVAEQLSSQADLYNRQDNAFSPTVTGRSRTIGTDGVALDWSYRPQQTVEVGFKVETSQSTDVLPIQPVGSSFNTQALRTVISFQGSGQARAEFSREEITLEHAAPDYVIPYELTTGRDVGKTYLWSTAVDYKLGKNIQLSGQYNGRTVNGRTPIHSGRMEVRAYF